jgi:aminomethyltransferase
VLTARTTPLHSSHLALGARMIDFGGWDMPVYYTGINDEHRAVRSGAGIFDVSHMGQVEVAGPGAHDFLQRVLSNDLDRIGDGQAQYTLLTNERGGIVDDLIAYRRGPDDYLLVVNAGNTGIDVAFLTAAAGDVPVVDRSAAHGMIALQGPTSDDVLAGAVADIPPFGFADRTIAGVDCLVARTGYTGERGVEIVTPAAGTVAVWDHLLAAGAVPCGLGARDTLRLEVCYPLHGNDITADTNAIAAGLGWVCALQKDFTGAGVLRRTKEEGPSERLVAFRMAERAIPRGGMEIVDAGGEPIGSVTSGTLSPSLDEGIGMGYVRADHAAVGSAIVIDVRGRRRDAVIATKPLLKKKES